MNVGRWLAAGKLIVCLASQATSYAGFIWLAASHAGLLLLPRPPGSVRPLRLAQGWLGRSVMNNYDNIIGGIALILVVVAGTGLRLWIEPRRRPHFIARLWGHIAQSAESECDGQPGRPAATVDETLSECLVRHFESSSASRQLLAMLADRSDGMAKLELIAVLNEERLRARKQELPAGVVRKILFILMGANLARSRQGKLHITEAGRLLHALLKRRAIAAKETPAFASP
jgi:hypothetical protein